MAKLLAAGFSAGAAIKVVNAALMVKDSDESFSSLDLVSVDLFTGKADFYKAGAAFSPVLKGNKLVKVELSGMPVGILENADFSHSSLHLSEGDIIALVSDGATQGNSEWLGQLLAARRGESAQTLAKEIAETARRKADTAHRDDISAVCIRIEKNE